MTLDRAIAELLEVSTDIRAVVVTGPDGTVLGCGPTAGDEAGALGGRLWEAAAERAAAFSHGDLDHLVVDSPDGAVVMAARHGHRALAVTGPRPAVGLALFDLRTCLDDVIDHQTRMADDTTIGDPPVGHGEAGA